MDSPSRIATTPTVARQTPTQDFGAVLKNAVSTAMSAGGSLMGSIPGAGIVSTAISNVASLASSGQAMSAASGVSSVGGLSSAVGAGSATGQTLASSPNGVPQELGGMIGQMRAEADRSMVMQMQMQQESREYNTLSNVLKVRHESAKSAINNIR